MRAHRTQKKRLIVAISGATGAIFGIRVLQLLMQEESVETHLIISSWAARTIVHETRFSLAKVQKMASVVYQPKNMGAAVSSGSFLTDGMIVAPCSVRTLAAIATGQGENLIHRAADVVLKERRKLVLAVRETPLTDIHLENMLKLSRMGARICPPVPAFYNQPQTLDDLIDNTAIRLLDQFDIHLDIRPRWTGDMGAANKSDTTLE